MQKIYGYRDRDFWVRYEYAILAALFLGILSLSYLSPIHSDDYSYKLRGLDLQHHVDLYFSWSGRVIADYVAPLILSIQSKFLIAILQVGGLFLVVFFASISPVFWMSSNTVDRRTGLVVFLLLLNVVFLSMPVFGQVVLWIGGSANYLWTAVIYSGFLCGVSRYVATQKISVVLYPVAVLAGCTNESVFPAVVFLLGLSIVYRYVVDQSVDKRLLVLVALLSLGAVVLLASPGNKIRLSSHEFDLWRSLSLLEKIRVHFYGRFFEAFNRSPLAYASVIFLMVYGYIKGNKSILMKVALVFFIMALLSNAVMVFAPFVPERSLIPAFVFVVFSLSFCVYSVYSYCSSALKKSLFCLSIYSILVVLCLIPVFFSVFQQDKIRNNFIVSGSGNYIDIPEYYFRWMPGGDRYRIDRFSNPVSMSKYFGVNGVDIGKVDFDYSVVSFSRPVNGVWRYSNIPLLESSFVVDNRDAENSVYAVKLVVVDMVGKMHNYYLNSHGRFNGGDYIYDDVKIPWFFIKSYAKKNLSLADYLHERHFYPVAMMGDRAVYVSSEKLIVFVGDVCRSETGGDRFFVRTDDLSGDKNNMSHEKGTFRVIDFTYKSGDYSNQKNCIVQRSIDWSVAGKIEVGQLSGGRVVWTTNASAAP